MHHLLKQICIGAGKEVVSSKTLKQLGASLRRQLSKQLKTDHKIAGASKRGFHIHITKLNLIWRFAVNPFIHCSKVEHTKFIRNTKTIYICRLARWLGQGRNIIKRITLKDIITYFHWQVNKTQLTTNWQNWIIYPVIYYKGNTYIGWIAKKVKP